MNEKKIINSLIVVAVLAASASCGSVQDEHPDECTTSADCDAFNLTKGWLCVDSACVPCGDDGDCSAELHYGQFATCIAGMCTPDCPSSQSGCPCVNGQCEGGLNCDAQTGLCHEPWTCEDLECLPNQRCVEGEGGADAWCAEDCEGWWQWNHEFGECLPWLNCEQGEENSILSECQEQQRYCLDLGATAMCGDCRDGYVEEAGQCRVALTCDDLGCADQLRECAEAAGNADAACLDCLEGHLEAEGECHPATCTRGVLGSIVPRCQAERRHCVAGDSFAHCGGCIAWHTEDGDTCRPVKNCTQIGCTTLKRECVPATLHQDAECGSCMGGYFDQWGDCVPLAGAVCEGGGNNISSICASQNRDCIQPECATPPCDSAYCGGCTWQSGCESSPLSPGLECYVELPQTGQCEQFIPCSEYGGCAPFNRSCDDDPTAHCTTCVFDEDDPFSVDYIEDEVTGLCRPAVTCAALSCSAGEQCHPHTPTADAFCHPGCPGGQIWSVWGCIGCPPCNGEGEDGHWPFPTLDGRCICRTEPGYFYNLAGDISAYPCDEDGDGWVRESARSAIDSDDPQVSTNARCDVRTVDRFVLENRVVNWFNPGVDCVADENCAGYLVIDLDEPLALYESDRNDDQYLLELFYSSAPYYGGRQPEARELNRLTKLCVAGGDYNDNLIDDIEEWDYRPLPPGFPIRLEPFNWFSYFVELHRGWYEPPVGNARHGTYHIREKSRRRSAADGDRVPLVYDAPEEDKVFHETCALWRDPGFDPANPTIGYDFARWSPSKGTYGWAMTWDPGMTRLTLPDGVGGWMSVAYGWDGMGMHSQYKCVRVVEDGNPDYDPEARPHLMTMQDVADGGFEVNECGIPGSADSLPPLPGADPANPHDPLVTCVSRAPAVDFVGWVARRYQGYSGPGDYVGGCVNQIVASRGRCGTCGLGRWINVIGGGLGGPHGPWNHGDFDVAEGCDDIDLTPLDDIAFFDLDELECDDESSNSSFLFVDDARGSDTGGFGSRRRPYKSISAALDRAEYLNSITHGGRRVIAVVVTADNYNETVTLRDGVSILGGFTVEAAGNESYWIRVDQPALNPEIGDHPGLTRIAAVQVEPDPERLVGIVARDIEEPTLLDRLFVDTVSNGQTGVSLLGVVAVDSPGLHLRDSRVHTGDAMAGADGAQPPEATAAPGGWTNGEPRFNNCLIDADYATGQRGGGAADCSAFSGWTNCASLWGQPHPAGGVGGSNDCSAHPSCAACTSVSAGADGSAGHAGVNAVPQHSSVNPGGIWAGGTQLDGGRGGTGRGGAGGAGIWLNTGCGKINGGGGGAGGCGGSPGRGGEHGGSSLALSVIGDSYIVAERCSFVSGDAGDGGRAGPGGKGGNGGPGATPSGGGFPGGSGGKGGDGGHGAGGNGGISCAALVESGAVIEVIESSVAKGGHGDGGPGVEGSDIPGNPSSLPGFAGDSSLGAPANSGLVCQ